MTKFWNKLSKKLKTLSDECQQYAARVLEQIAAAGNGVYHLSDEQRRLVREGLDDLDAGRIATAVDMAAFRDRHRA